MDINIVKQTTISLDWHELAVLKRALSHFYESDNMFDTDDRVVAKKMHSEIETSDQ